MGLKKPDVMGAFAAASQDIGTLKDPASAWGDAKPFSLRFPVHLLKVLADHFKGKGIKINAGMNMVLIEYMKKEGLIK